VLLQLSISLVLLQESYCVWKKGDNVKLKEKVGMCKAFYKDNLVKYHPSPTNLFVEVG